MGSPSNVVCLSVFPAPVELLARSLPGELKLASHAALAGTASDPQYHRPLACHSMLHLLSYHPKPEYIQQAAAVNGCQMRRHCRDCITDHVCETPCLRP